MAINPVNLSRVSQSMRTSFVTSSLRRNQLELLSTQTRIASGQRFISPSDDPVASSRVMDLTHMLARQSQFMANVSHGDNVLAAADSAVTEINSLLIEAQTLASQNVSNLTSAAEREADAELIAAIRHQLQLVGNRQFDGRFIFAGRDTTDRPFIEVLSGVAYVGDTGDLLTRVSDAQTAVINVPGNLLFGALSSRIESGADLSPLITEQTRLEDLGGANGEGVRIGRLIFNEPGGAGVY
ncbi:MAG: flagellar hook-associated protein FlgL, partial [Planctomycetes bacterium]|nr:flagellar hook-associated protein FlgL [Planctomycetota bacterium]